MRKSLLRDLICGLLILLFLYTALSKFFRFRQFREVLHLSPLIGAFSSVIAFALPVTEILICVLLFFPSARRSGLYASLSILILFTLYLIYMLSFATHLPCSCGGVIGKMTWRQHLIFNLGCIGLTIVGLRLHQNSTKGWLSQVPYPTREDVL